MRVELRVEGDVFPAFAGVGLCDGLIEALDAAFGAKEGGYVAPVPVVLVCSPEERVKDLLVYLPDYKRPELTVRDAVFPAQCVYARLKKAEDSAEIRRAANHGCDEKYEY